jgi:hypothetical protein
MDKYEDMSTAAPTLEKLPKLELDRVHKVLNEAQMKTSFDEEAKGDIGTDEFDSEEEALDVFRDLISRIEDVYARAYARNPMQFELLEREQEEITDAGYSVEELRELAEERDLL